MPIVIRYVEPYQERHLSTVSEVSRPTKDKDGSSEPSPSPEEYKDTDALLSVTSSLQILESVSTNKMQALTVHNLATLIRQLGSIAQHAENLMGTIAEGLVTCYARTVQLESRTRQLAEEVLPSLDPELEAVEGFEIPHPDFQFKSKREVTQFILTKHQPPDPLEEQIQSAHTPPLHLFSSLWPDGCNGQHRYSYPGFFFEHWRTSIKKETLRRKSATQLLSPTSPVIGKPNGKIGKGARISRQSSAGNVSPVNGAKKLKRNTPISSSFHGRSRPRPRSFHSSNLSLQNAGLSSSGKQKGFARTYSVRMPPGYTRGGTRNTLRVPKVKHLGEPLSKAIALNFDTPYVEVSAPQKDLPLRDPDVVSVKSEKSNKGGFLRRTLSLRQSRSRSRSPKPTPRVVPSDSVLNGARMYKVEDSKKESDNLSVLPRKHLEQLDLATTGFDTRLAVNDSHKLNSTFKASPSLSSRSITPLFARVSTPPKDQPQRTGSPSLNNWTRSYSDAREHFNKLPRFQRSATVSNTNPNSKPVIKRTTETLKVEARPASIAVDDYRLQPKMYSKTLSQTSLDISRTASSQSNSSGHSPRPHSMLIGDSSGHSPRPHSTLIGDYSGHSPRPHSMLIGDYSSFEKPLSQEFATKVSVNSKTKSRPKRPAPPRPSEGRRKSGSDSGGHVTPEITCTNTSPDQTGPPPPPQRHVSLSTSPNPKPASGVVAGSGPATPGSAHTAQRHSTLDSERKESMAMALTDVLNNMNRRSLTGHLVSPTAERSEHAIQETSQVPIANGDLNRTLTPEEDSPIRTKLERLLSPVESTPRSKLIDLDKTVTSFDCTPHSHLVHTDTFTSIGKRSNKRLLSKQRSRQGSLYISPLKLSGLTSPDSHMTIDEPGFNKRAGQILKAAGVDNGTLEVSRNDLLVAIRTGLQLKKVELEAANKTEEVAWDVAAILGRYEVLHSDSDDGSDYSENDWDDFDEP